MPLTPGSKLGPYEILSAIGAGGMGEVYRAKDTRLDRTVAVKILLGHVADRTDARERFEREARAVSSLNHPNICTLYDVGTHDGLAYLVMEHLEGETLATRLEKGALSADQTISIAIEIASAMRAVEGGGVVHRDLKPGNILVTKSGVKLLDFGLAKMESAIAALPEQADTLTQEGVITGTLQYMAPEQLEGQKADARADIFAFGAVLYEMVSGRRAFEGSSAASVIAKIVGGQSESLEQLPHGLDHVVKRCLAKDREERWQSVADIKHELEWLAEGRDAVAPGTPARAAPAIANGPVWPRCAWIRRTLRAHRANAGA